MFNLRVMGITSKCLMRSLENILAFNLEFFNTDKVLIQGLDPDTEVEFFRLPYGNAIARQKSYLNRLMKL